MATTIIAGRFGQQSEVDETIAELLQAGYPRERICSFYVNPPGQHDAYPLGGDHDMSAGAQESRKGVAGGAIAGAVAGVAVAPFLGPVGAVTGGLVGAHVGGLVGGVSRMKEQGETGAHQEDAENAEPVRHSGMMVAVAIAGQEAEDRVINLLRAAGAFDLERAQGTIEQGDWIDFDPVAPPVLLESRPDTLRGSEPQRRA